MTAALKHLVLDQLDAVRIASRICLIVLGDIGVRRKSHNLMCETKNCENTWGIATPVIYLESPNNEREQLSTLDL